MTRAACERWITLSDRVATGEPLADDERAFQREHELECPDCGAEARVWVALGRAREDTTVLDEATVWAPRQPSFASQLRRARTPAVLAVLALAMLSALAAAAPASLRRFGRTAPPVAKVVPATPAALSSASGHAALVGDGPSVSASAPPDAPDAPDAPRAAALEPTTRGVAVGDNADVNALSAEELLARARSLRASGRALEASQAYRRLISTWPRSPEARVGLISLGELELSELSEPAAALRDFTAYLKTRGNLDPEARYGRIRALGRVGRHAEELSEARDFVRDYPSSLQASDLRTRLSL
jgi:tetratricopeptide (TPR) repeat protein